MGNSSYGLVQSDSQNRLGLRSITAGYETRLGFFAEDHISRGFITGITASTAATMTVSAHWQRIGTS